MLALSNTVKEDLKCNSAELGFGTSLTLPGQIFRSMSENFPSDHFVTDLRQKMSDVIYTPSRAYHKPYYVPADLTKADFILLRRDSVRKPLTPNYIGPHQVISRTPKYFIINLAGKSVTVSIDRLKTAYISTDNTTSSTSQTIPDPEASCTHSPSTPESVTDTLTRTRSGRHVYWSAKFVTYQTYYWSYSP